MWVSSGRNFMNFCGNYFVALLFTVGSIPTLLTTALLATTLLATALHTTTIDKTI